MTLRDRMGMTTTAPRPLPTTVEELIHRDAVNVIEVLHYFLTDRDMYLSLIVLANLRRAWPEDER